MYVRPLQRQRKVSIGLVLPNLRVVTEWGEERELDKMPKYKLYAYDMRALNEHVKAGKARMKYWAGYPIVFAWNDVLVKNAPRDTIQNKPIDQALEGLQRWAHWVQANGGNVGSISGSAMSMWRAIIERDYFLNIRRGQNLPEKIEWFSGPRIESQLGTYSNVAAWDIKSAYPYACSQIALPARYVDQRQYHLDGNGYAHAVVRVPKLDFGPLPIRLPDSGQVIYPSNCVIESTWELAELRMAHELGCDITLDKVWIGAVYTKTWEAWLKSMLTGRELGGIASRLAKITANALWGTFIAEGSAKWVWYENGQRYQYHEMHKVRPQATGIAGHVVAAVRRRLYKEALAYGNVVAAHTDGIIVKDGWQPENNGNDVGQWAMKWSGKIADVRAVGMHRYFDGMQWHYSTGDEKSFNRAWNDALRSRRYHANTGDLQRFRQVLDSGMIVKSAPNDYFVKRGIEV